MNEIMADWIIKLFCIILTAISSIGVGLVLFLIKKIVDSDRRLSVIETIVHDLKEGRREFYSEIRELIRGRQ